MTRQRLTLTRAVASKPKGRERIEYLKLDRESQVNSSIGLRAVAVLEATTRLDDTLTSIDSRVRDPFSAAVVDKREYRSARVYGHITEIDMSGRLKGIPA